MMMKVAKTIAMMSKKKGPLATMMTSVALAASVGCSDRPPPPRKGIAVAAVGSHVLPASGPLLVALQVLPPVELQVLEDGSGGYLSARLLVDARLSDGSLRDLTPLAVISVVDPGVATVGPGGRVLGVAPGRTTIEVAVRDARGIHVARRDVLVRGAPSPAAEVERLELHPPGRVLSLVSSARGVAQEQGLAAVLVRTDGSREDVTDQVDLQVLDAVTRAPSSAATLLPDGRVRATVDRETVDVRAALRRLHRSAATRFVLGADPAPLTSAVAWSGEPLASSPNPLDLAALAALRAAGVEPAPLSDDEEFLRRVTLDAAGRLPTEGERALFLGDAAPDKRARKVAALLATDDFVVHWARDFVVPTLAPAYDALHGDFNRAIEADLRAGLSLGAIVTRMVTDERTVQYTKFEEWYAGDDGRGRPSTLILNLAGMTMRCAVCHDHVSSTAWPDTRAQGLSSFFAKNQGQSLRPRVGDRVEPVFNLDGTAIPGAPLGPDPGPNNEFPPLEVRQRRAHFMQLFTDSDAFHRGAANRIWADLVRPIVGVEDFVETQAGVLPPPVQQAVLDELARQLRLVGTSLRGFLQVVFTSRLYQLTSDSATDRFDDLLARKPLARQHSAVLERGLHDTVGNAGAFTPGEFFEGTCGGRGARTTNLAQPGVIANAAQGLPGRVGLGGSELDALVVEVVAGRLTLDDAVRSLYRRALTREPTADELRATLSAVAGAPAREALEDVVFGLCASAEFATR